MNIIRKLLIAIFYIALGIAMYVLQKTDLNFLEVDTSVVDRAMFMGIILGLAGGIISCPWTDRFWFILVCLVLLTVCGIALLLSFISGEHTFGMVIMSIWAIATTTMINHLVRVKRSS